MKANFHSKDVEFTMPIGTEFNIGVTIFKVALPLSETSGCRGCYFYSTASPCNHAAIARCMGECEKDYRTDRQDIIFVESK